MVRTQPGGPWKRTAGRVVSMKTTTYHTMDGKASIVVSKVVPRLYELCKFFNRVSLCRLFYQL